MSNLFPGFLMTVCQDYSRKTGISMEDVQLNFQVLSAPREEVNHAIEYSRQSCHC